MAKKNYNYSDTDMMAKKMEKMMSQKAKKTKKKSGKKSK